MVLLLHATYVIEIVKKYKTVSLEWGAGSMGGRGFPSSVCSLQVYVHIIICVAHVVTVVTKPKTLGRGGPCN